jgi:hypothetical protein
MQSEKSHALAGAAMSEESAGDGRRIATAAVAGERNPLKAPEPLGDGGGESAPRPNGWKAECGAKTRSGGACRRPPLAGRTRCRLHGGATPSGIASPHFKNGARSRYLKHLPREMIRGYKAALADPEITALDAELALLTARIGQLLDRLSEAPATPWGEAVEALDDVLTAGEAERDAKLAELARIVRTGAGAAKSQEATWDALRGLIAERTRTAAAEWRRRHDLDAFLPKAQAVALMFMVRQAVCEEVTDRKTLQRINNRLAVLMGYGGPSGLLEDISSIEISDE